jgi:hypothetical protein
VRFFAVIAIEVSGETYGWQGEYVPAHRGVTRQDAFWEVMGNTLKAAKLPTGGPHMIVTTFFSLEPQELPR